MLNINSMKSSFPLVFGLVNMPSLNKVENNFFGYYFKKLFRKVNRYQECN